MVQQLVLFNGGLQTKVAPHLVEKNQAIECINVNLDKGSIYPYKTFIEDEEKIATGYSNIVFNNEFITSDLTESRSYAVFGNRLYFSNGTYSEYGLMRYSSSGIVDAVAPAITVYATLTATPTTGIKSKNADYAYVYTVIDSDEIESAPSMPIYVTLADQDVELELDIELEDVNETVAKRRIYRTGGANPTYNLIAELDAATLTFTDNIADIDVSRIELTSFDAAPPPTDLINLIENNGTMWGSVGNRIYFSKNGRPEFWGALDFIVIGGECTGLGKFSEYVIAFTKSDAYIISGYNIDTIVLKKLPYNEGCLNHKSIANVTEILVWASKNGICAFNGTSITILTKNILSWSQDANIGSLTFGEIDGTFGSNVGYRITSALGLRGKYYAVYQEGIGILDIENNSIASTVALQDAKTLFYDYNENRICVTTEDLTVLLFDNGEDNMEAEWKTPLISDDGYSLLKNFKKVQFDAVPAEVTVYVDDKKVITIANTKEFYLPAGSYGRAIQFDIKTTNEIKYVKYGYGVMK